MLCAEFDPITTASAPCCAVCSYRCECSKEKTAVSATNTNNGNVEKEIADPNFHIHYNKDKG